MDQALPPVQQHAYAEGGRWFIELGDGSEAELTWRRIGPDTIALDHTYTPPDHRGQGVALRLVREAVDEARRNGTRIKPVCAYAVAEFRRHRDWADVLAA